MSSENQTNSVNRQLAAILFADIVGYTALMQKGEKTALNILNRYQSVCEEMVGAHDGEIIKSYGDGSIILFTSTINAVQCAKAMQIAFNEEPQVPLRIGIHIGEIVRKDNDVFGNGVNIASRIESMGVAGAVLLSNFAYAKVKNQEDLDFKSLGTYDFKNVDEPIEVFAVSNPELVVPELDVIEGKFKSHSESKDLDQSFFQQIWNKKIPQLMMVYFISGWAFLQISNWALNHFRVSPRWSEILFILIVGMIPSLLVYFNNRGRMHEGEFKIGEKILFPANFLAVGVVIFFLFKSVDLGAMTRTVNYIDEDGNQVSRTMVKKDYLLRLPVFPFEQINPDSTTAWVGDVLHFAFHLDLAQDDNMSVGRARVPSGSENEFPTRSEKIEIAKGYGGKHYIDGKYSYDGNILELTTSLRNGSNGNLIDERSFKGDNIFELIDSSSAYMRVALGLTQAQIEAYVDQDVAETFTDNIEALRHFSKFIGRNGNFEDAFKAVELDSTFAYANYRISRTLFVYSAGESETIKYANRAYRHRKRMPPQDQIAITTHKYLAEKNFTKAEELLKLQLEINPDGDTRTQLLILYSNSKQSEKYLELAQKQYDEEGSSTAQVRLATGYMRNGLTKEAEEIWNLLLESNPKSAGFLENLMTTKILKGEYVQAREIVDKIALLHPNLEINISKNIEALNFLVSNDPEEIKNSDWISYARSEDGEMRFETYIEKGIMFQKAENQGGFFLFPTKKDNWVRGTGRQFFGCKLIRNDDEEVYKMGLMQGAGTEEFDHDIWIQDSVIWKAEALLKAGEYESSLNAYEAAIEDNPEHYYLFLAKEHLEFMLSTSAEDLNQLYQGMIGDYGDFNISEEDGLLYLRLKPLGSAIIRPISKTEFITLSKYNQRGKLIMEGGKIIAIETYDFDKEKEEWKKEPDTMFVKKVFLN